MEVNGWLVRCSGTFLVMQGIWFHALMTKEKYSMSGPINQDGITDESTSAPWKAKFCYSFFSLSFSSNKRRERQRREKKQIPREPDLILNSCNPNPYCTCIKLEFVFYILLHSHCFVKWDDSNCFFFFQLCANIKAQIILFLALSRITIWHSFLSNMKP